MKLEIDTKVILQVPEGTSHDGEDELVCAVEQELNAVGVIQIPEGADYKQVGVRFHFGHITRRE